MYILTKSIDGVIFSLTRSSVMKKINVDLSKFLKAVAKAYKKNKDPIISEAMINNFKEYLDAKEKNIAEDEVILMTNKGFDFLKYVYGDSENIPSFFLPFYSFHRNIILIKHSLSSFYYRLHHTESKCEKDKPYSYTKSMDDELRSILSNIDIDALIDVFNLTKHKNPSLRTDFYVQTMQTILNLISIFNTIAIIINTEIDTPSRQVSDDVCLELTKIKKTIDGFLDDKYFSRVCLSD